MSDLSEDGPNLDDEDDNFPISEEIAQLREKIDQLDQEIVNIIKERTRISRIIGQIRQAQGGPRLVHAREIQVVEKFDELGPDGRNIAHILLRLGRGPVDSDG